MRTTGKPCDSGCGTCIQQESFDSGRGTHKTRESFVTVGMAHAYNTGKLFDSRCGTYVCITQESLVLGVARTVHA